jgi:tetratricopeptide (TPR) repeat protein
VSEHAWDERFERQADRYRDGESRLPDDPAERQRQLTRIGNAAYGAALCALMLGRVDDARDWFARAAARYHESYADAPPGSWGRPIGAIKAHVLRGDWDGAQEAARWTLAEDAAQAESPIGRYAAALAYGVLGDWDEMRINADVVRVRDDFPHDVGDALAFIAAEDVVGYVEAIESVLESFETREEYLEDVAVADTVLVLQALATKRGFPAELQSALLPAGA